jgi:hypothetical protein
MGTASGLEQVSFWAASGDVDSDAVVAQAPVNAAINRVLKQREGQIVDMVRLFVAEPTPSPVLPVQSAMNVQRKLTAFFIA